MCFHCDSEQFHVCAKSLVFERPWPFANLSLAMDTSDPNHDDIHTQIFSWYSTTTVVPRESEIDVVLHMSNVARNASMGKDDEPVLTARPTIGGTAVEFWPPFAPIPMNYGATQSHFVPVASFGVSWIMTISPGTVNTVLQKIASIGVFDKVERRVHEAQVLTMDHAGIMATDKAALQSTARPEGAVLAPQHNTNALDSDTVPVL